MRSHLISWRIILNNHFVKIYKDPCFRQVVGNFSKLVAWLRLRKMKAEQVQQAAGHSPDSATMWYHVMIHEYMVCHTMMVIRMYKFCAVFQSSLCQRHDSAGKKQLPPDQVETQPLEDLRSVPVPSEPETCGIPWIIDERTAYQVSKNSSWRPRREWRWEWRKERQDRHAMPRDEVKPQGKENGGVHGVWGWGWTDWMANLPVRICGLITRGLFSD